MIWTLAVSMLNHDVPGTYLIRSQWSIAKPDSLRGRRYDLETYVHLRRSEVSLSQIVGCISCRQVFESVPERCPYCDAVTFVHYDKDEDLNTVCEELIFGAELARSRSGWRQMRRTTARNQNDRENQFFAHGIQVFILVVMNK